MQNMKKWFVLAGLFALLGFSGCGSTGIAKDTAAMTEESVESYDVTSDYGMAEAPAEEAVEEEALDESGTAEVTNQEQKLIITENIDVETEEFDTFWQNIHQKVEALGGYIEYSEISGQAEYGDRSGNLTIRIPAEQIDALITAVDEKGTVTYESKTTENVTLQYVDLQSHLKALRIEEESLLSLLEKADKLSDLFEIQARLTEVRYQLESYESQLRVMDNQVTYSTVNLSVREVTIITVVEEKGFWAEAQKAFMDSLYSIKDAVRGLALWFIGNLPVLTVYAVIIIVVVIIVRKTNKSRQKKLDKKMQEAMKNVVVKEDKDDTV